MLLRLRLLPCSRHHLGEGVGDDVDERAGARRSLLHRRDYRLLLSSFATSQLGDYASLVALMAYVFAQTQSPSWVSAAALSRFLPSTVLSPIAGVVADRYERRTVMAVGDVLQFAVMTALAVTVALSGPVLLVVVLSAVSSSAGTLYQAAASAVVVTVVPEDELAAANALMSAADQLAFVAGPAGGALLLLLGEPAIALGLTAAAFALATLLILAVRTRSRRTTPSAGSSALGEAREGVRVLVGDRVVLVLVGCLVAATLVYGVELVVLVVVSSELLGIGSQGLGWLLAASGIGGILGATLSPRFARARRPTLTIAVLVLLTGVPLATLALIRLPALAFLVLVVEGVAFVALEILIETTMQRAVPRDVLGRVSGLVLSLFAVSTALGTLAAPALTEALGLPATLAVAGLTPVVLAAASLSVLRGFDAATERGRHALEPRVAVLRKLRLLEGAGPAALERLAAAVQQERLASGTVVLRQGDPAEDLFVLVDGDVVVDHDDGVTVRRINQLTAPDYLGEIGLVERVPRTATVTTATDAVLWRIPGDLFLDAVQAAPLRSPTLTTGISTRLARTPGRA